MALKKKTVFEVSDKIGKLSNHDLIKILLEDYPDDEHLAELTNRLEGMIKMVEQPQHYYKSDFEKAATRWGTFFPCCWTAGLDCGYLVCYSIFLIPLFRARLCRDATRSQRSEVIQGKLDKLIFQNQNPFSGLSCRSLLTGFLFSNIMEKFTREQVAGLRDYYKQLTAIIDFHKQTDNKEAIEKGTIKRLEVEQKLREYYENHVTENKSFESWK